MYVLVGLFGSDPVLKPPHEAAALFFLRSLFAYQLQFEVPSVMNTDIKMVDLLCNLGFSNNLPEVHKHQTHSTWPAAAPVITAQSEQAERDDGDTFHRKLNTAQWGKQHI